jgi:hypothetical protein
MHEITAIYGGILFLLFTPGLIIRIPTKGSLLTASIIHSIIFAILYYLTFKIVYSYSANPSRDFPVSGDDGAWSLRRTPETYNKENFQKGPVQTCYSEYICNDIDEMVSNLKIFIDSNISNKRIDNSIELIKFIERLINLLITNKCRAQLANSKQKCYSKYICGDIQNAVTLLSNFIKKNITLLDNPKIKNIDKLYAVGARLRKLSTKNQCNTIFP